MARVGADALVKRNSKLEAFLKKAWEEDTFDRLRAHEACIVCSDKEDKAFKFVVLTDEWIYLTENPPKKIQEEVHLKNIVSIELVNDLPDFLQGDEQAHTQHILITYMVCEPAKKRKGKSPRNGPSISRGSSTLRLVKETARREKLSVGYFERAQNGRRLSSGSQRDRESSVGEDSEQESMDSPQGKSKKRHSLSTSDLSSSRLLPGGRPLPKRQNATSKPKLGVSHSESDLNSLEQRNSKSHSSNLASTMLNRYSSTKYKEASRLPRPLPNPMEEWDENGEYIDKRKKEPLKLSVNKNGELKLDLGALKDEGEEDDAFYNSSSNSKGPPKVPKIRINSSSSEAGSRGSSRSRQGSGDISEDGEIEEEEVWRKTKLHLYILNLSSPILMLTRCAWNNYLIRSTLLLDPELNDRAICLTSRKPKGYRDKFDKLFGQLKTELLNPHNSMEQTFELLSELKAAAERNFALKKLFWKSSEMFTFIVKQLQEYLPKSAAATADESIDEAKIRRADEFELVILLVETLALMFRETETLPSRLQAIQSASGKCALDLLVMLTCIPDIPERHVPMSSKAAKLTGLVASEKWRCLTDAELAKLEKEFTNVATIVLSELILIAHQANWGDSDGNFFNICWVTKVLDELNTTEKFVGRLLTHMLRLISPSRLEALLPDQVILVFHQFSVLQMLVEYSSRVVAFIRNNFYEEFKYYIQGPVIQQKLPKHYPLTPYTLQLMEEVVCTVLQRKAQICLQDDVPS